MILRPLSELPEPAPNSDDSAWHLVEQSQRRARPPLLLIPQPAHAVLSGDLAQALLPEAFAEIPQTIVQAIRMHDTGWGILDAAQIHSLRSGDDGGKNGIQKQAPSGRVISFLATPAADAVTAWKASIDETQKIAPECGYIVSQHFSLLALPDDPIHIAFAKQEQSRREKILKQFSLNLADLERWTDALGFCDLLSLYLCSIAGGRASMPRIHPARKNAIPNLHIRQAGDEIFLSESLLRKGTTIAIHGLLHPAPASASAAQALRWIFA